MEETSKKNYLLTDNNRTGLNHTAVTDGKSEQAIVILNTRNLSYQTHLQPDMRQPTSKTKCIIQLSHLSAENQTELAELIGSYPGLSGDTPSRTTLIEHDIDVGDA